MVTKKTTKTSAEPAGESYQTIRAELDAVLAKLQDPACSVDEAVALYEQALQLTAMLEMYLESAENRVKKIRADFTAKVSSSASDASVGAED